MLNTRMPLIVNLERGPVVLENGSLKFFEPDIPLSTGCGAYSPSMWLDRTDTETIRQFLNSVNGQRDTERIEKLEELLTKVVFHLNDSIDLIERGVAFHTVASNLRLLVGEIRRDGGMTDGV